MRQGGDSDKKGAGVLDALRDKPAGRSEYEKRK